MRRGWMGWKVCAPPLMFSALIFNLLGLITLLLPRIRLYGAKTFKALGTLTYHKEGCHTLAFSNQLAEKDLTDDDEYLSAEEKAGRRFWLASGGKDGQVCIWRLSTFSK